MYVFSYLRKHKRNLLIMRNLIVFMLFFGFQAHSSIFSQSRVNVDLKNSRIEALIKVIESQTQLGFLYDEDYLKNTKPISMSAKNETVENVLKAALEGTGLGFEIDHNTILIKPLPVEAAPAVSNLPIKGKVTDTKGNTLPGANIRIKGTTKGTITDMDGNFSFEATKGDVLIISFIGYASQEVKVGDEPIDVALVAIVAGLDEVQVIGYGTITKHDNTGAVSTMKTDDIIKQPKSNFAEALEGKMTGVVVTNSDGAVGSGVNIQIRGLNSIGSGSTPLFIVDGVIIDGGSTQKNLGSYIHSTSPLNSINPNDIASIDILKDADATAIYGSRATNGVVLITTKRAQFGKTKVNVDMNTGFNQATYLPKLLNTEQYVALRKEAYALDNKTPSLARAADLMDQAPWVKGAYTDWTKYEMGNSAPFTNVNANISGGDKSLNYYFSTGYMKQNDIQPGDPYQERISSRLNVNSLGFNDKLETSIAIQYSTDKIKPSRVATNYTGGTKLLPPNFPLYAADGNYYWGSSQSFYFSNPEAALTSKAQSVTNDFLGSVNFVYLLYKGLKAKALFSYDNQSNESESEFPSSAVNPYYAADPTSSSSFMNYKSMNFEPQLTYDGEFLDGTIDALLGSTWFKSTTSNKGVDWIGFSGDEFMGSWDFANAYSYKSSSENDVRFRSYFARLNYNWEKKYILNLSYRRDGSSKFGPNYKWGDFGAVGGAWIFSNESYVKNTLPFLSFGKLRASWGVTGNDQIADYQYLNLYGADNVAYGTKVGLNTQYLYNEDIHWEQTKKLEAALEFGLFKDRISGSVAWYRNRTSDFLVSAPTASQTGFSSFVSNFKGIVQNKGWEFELHTRNIVNENFQWKTNINFTIAKNSLYKYDDLAGSEYSTMYEIGKPLDIIRSFSVDSISKVNGYAKFRDVNKDGKLSFPNDYVTIGSRTPRAYGGMENVFTYKSFEFGFTITCAQQLVTNWYYNSSLPGRAANSSTLLLDNYWQKPGDDAIYPRLTTGLVSNANVVNLRYSTLSNMAYNDILWFRLNNVSLKYTLPVSLVKKGGLSNASVYVRGQNLLFYSPVDLGKDPQQMSLQSGTPLKSWLFGIQLSF